MGLVPLLLLLLLSKVAAVVGTATFSAGRFAYRDVNATVELCTPEVCADDRPSLGVFMSHQTDWSFHTQANGAPSGQLDLLVGLVTTVEYPASVLCYFRKDDEYKLNVNWLSFLRGQAGSVSVGERRFCVGMVLEEIIEYVDVNGDVMYTPEHDQEIARHPLLNMSWGEMKVVQSVHADAITCTSSDGVFELEWALAPTPFKEVSGFVLTPNATRLDIHVVNFPYTAGVTNSRLSLKVVLSHAGGFDEAHSWMNATRTEQAIFMAEADDQMFFEWKEFASAMRMDEKSDVAVLSSNLSVAYRNNNPLGLAKAVLGEQVASQAVYFSFADAMQPSLLKWENAVGYGDPPEDYPLADMVLVLIIFASLVVPAIAVGVVIWLRLRKHDPDEDNIVTNATPTADHTTQATDVTAPLLSPPSPADAD